MLPFVELGGMRVGTHDLFSLGGIAAGLAIYYSELRRRGVLDGGSCTSRWPCSSAAGSEPGRCSAWEHLAASRDLGAAPLTWVVEHSGKSLIGAIAGGWVAAVVAKWAFRYRGSTRRLLRAGDPGRGCDRAGRMLPRGAAARCADGPAVGRPCPACLSRGVRLVPRLRRADAPEHGLRDPVQPRRDRGDRSWRHRIPVRGDLLKAYLLAAFVFRFSGSSSCAGNEPQAFGLSGPQLVLIPMTALLVVHFAREAHAGALRVPVAPPVPGGAGHRPLDDEAAAGAGSLTLLQPRY